MNEMNEILKLIKTLCKYLGIIIIYYYKKYKFNKYLNNFDHTARLLVQDQKYLEYSNYFLNLNNKFLIFGKNKILNLINEIANINTANILFKYTLLSILDRYLNENFLNNKKLKKELIPIFKDNKFILYIRFNSKVNNLNIIINQINIEPHIELVTANHFFNETFETSFSRVKISLTKSFFTMLTCPLNPNANIELENINNNSIFTYDTLVIHNFNCLKRFDLILNSKRLSFDKKKIKNLMKKAIDNL